MAGDGRTAIEASEKLAGIATDDMASTYAWAQPIKTAPYFAHAQYSALDTVLGLADPGDKFPYVKGMWHYARGVAKAAKGELDSAAAEAGAIDEIATKGDLSFLVDNYVPGDQLLQIARHVVLARIAQHQGDYPKAVDEFKRAAALEAAEAFQTTLKAAPNNGWAIYGLIEAHKTLGDKAGAEAGEAVLDKVWIGSGELLDLSKL